MPSSDPTRPTRRGRVTSLVAALLTLALLAGCGGRTPLPEEPAEDTDAEDVDAPADDVAAPIDDPVGDGAPPPPSVDDEATAPPVERRGFAAPVRAAWVHLFDDTLTDPSRRRAMLDELEAAGIDTLFAQPIRRHDAYHRSQVLPRTPDPSVGDGTDVLAALLEEAHPRGIAVHAWFSVAPTDHAVYDDLPDPPGWVASTHGRHAPEADRWVTRDVDGAWSDFLDVGLPAVQDHVVAVTTELAAAYPIDGIHLDYVRYPSPRHGYHPTVLDRYRADTGVTGTPAPDDPRFVTWRQQRGTELVGAVRDGLAALDDDVLLSAAVITWGEGPGGPGTPDFAATRAAREALQDWPSWVERGLVDAVLPMNYFRAHDAQQAAWFDRWLAFESDLARSHDAAIVPGIGAWLNASDAVVDQSRRAVASTDGAAIYSVQQPSADEDRAVWARLAEEVWPTP